MTSTTLCYDTFEALQSHASPPLAVSPELLVRHISCSLINIRTIISSQQNPSVTGSAKLCDEDDGNGSLLLPEEATSETISKFLAILRHLETSVLNPILFLKNLCNVRQKDIGGWSSVSSNARSRKLCSKSILSTDAQVQKLLCRLSRNLNRVRSQFESLVYWTDNMLLASLANSAREEQSNERSLTTDHAQSSEKFDILIDSCIDVTHAGWSIVNQLSRAETILAEPISFRPIEKSRSREGFGKLKSLKSRKKPASCFKRRLHHRSIGQYRPKSGITDLHRVIARLMTSLDPQNTLRSIQVVNYFLRVI